MNFIHPAAQPLFCRVGLAVLGLLLLCGSSGCRLWSRNRNVDGVRYYQQGQYPVALQRFEQARQANPKNADAYYNLAAVMHRTGLQNRDPNQLAQAEANYNLCLDYNKDHVDCHRGLAVLLTETGRVPEAFRLLQNWTTTSPSSSDARVELARLYEEYGDPRTAELQLQQALQLNLNNPRAHAALGRIKEQTGDYPQALSNYQRSYTLNTFQPELANRIALLKQRVGTTPGPQPYLAPQQPTGPPSLRSAGPFAPNRTY